MAHGISKRKSFNLRMRESAKAFMQIKGARYLDQEYISHKMMTSIRYTAALLIKICLQANNNFIYIVKKTCTYLYRALYCMCSFLFPVSKNMDLAN